MGLALDGGKIGSFAIEKANSKRQDTRKKIGIIQYQIQSISKS
jgi:hypothetical protein